MQFTHADTKSHPNMSILINANIYQNTPFALQTIAYILQDTLCHPFFTDLQNNEASLQIILHCNLNKEILNETSLVHGIYFYTVSVHCNITSKSVTCGNKEQMQQAES
jgi:hypothetical protein